MKKRDFIQQASIEFMPQAQWDVDKAIRYAEKLWHKLEQRGYGDARPAKAKDMVNYYQLLSAIAKKQFDQFWLAFDYKQGKQRAAMRWQQLGELTSPQLKKTVNAAKQTATSRKNLSSGQTPVMAERWLSELRYDDFDQTSTEKGQKKQAQAAQKIREIAGTLAHAKKMANNCSDDFWSVEVKRLTDELKTLRHTNQEH